MLVHMDPDDDHRLERRPQVTSEVESLAMHVRVRMHMRVRVRVRLWPSVLHSSHPKQEAKISTCLQLQPGTD